MLSLSNFASEMEREKVSQRTYDAMFRKAKVLHVTGNKVFGYDNVPVYGSETNIDGTRRRQHVVRRINGEQSKVVTRVFEMYPSGFGLAGIAKALNEYRIPLPHGGTRGWCPTAIRDILHANCTKGWCSGRERRRFSSVGPESGGSVLSRSGFVLMLLSYGSSLRCSGRRSKSANPTSLPTGRGRSAALSAHRRGLPLSLPSQQHRQVRDVWWLNRCDQAHGKTALSQNRLPLCLPS